MNWAIDLSQYCISYEPRQTIKAQAVADFVVEMTYTTIPNVSSWTIHVDGSSNEKGSRASVMIENDEGIMIEFLLRFAF